MTAEGSRRKLTRSERGATAIEYALIGALIGLGLIGSLVTTKGSLNAIFGTASGQMGSASAADAAAVPARFGYWSARTVQSSSTTKSIPSRSITTNITYSDGTTVTMRQEIDANGVRTGRNSFQVNDFATNVTTIYGTDYNGTVSTFEQVTYKTMPPVSYNQTLSVDGLYSNGTLTGVRTSTYAGDSATSTNTAPPTQKYQTDVANAATDLAYFMTYVPAGL